MNKEARQRFIEFATDPSTPWKASFRDLNAAITRMSTLAPSGRINKSIVDEEIDRLAKSWRDSESTSETIDLLSDVMDESQIASLDRFDQTQLAEVIRVCRQSKSLAAAGRTLFNVSRQAKQKPNDSDRLRKYLAKFGVQWSDIDTTSS